MKINWKKEFIYILKNKKSFQKKSNRKMKLNNLNKQKFYNPNRSNQQEAKKKINLMNRMAKQNHNQNFKLKSR